VTRRKHRPVFTPPAPSPPWTGIPVPPDVNVYLDGTDEERHLCAPCARKLRAKGKTLVIQRQSKRTCQECECRVNRKEGNPTTKTKAPEREPRTIEDMLTKAQTTATELELELGQLQQLQLFREDTVKESEAVEHLRAFTFGLMKYRSVTKAEIDDEELLAETWPWVFGNKCPLPALSVLLDFVENGKSLSPTDYYNMMTVLYRFMPEVKLYVDVYLIDQGKEPLPEELPSRALSGWD
jgi:hypothetical protein